MNLKTLYKISYGLYVVSSKKDDKLNGQIANTIFQATADPPTMVVCLNNQNLTNEFVRESNLFGVSILTKETPMQFIGHFGFKSGREVDKFKDLNFKIGATGCPIVLDYTLGYLEAQVFNQLNVGTHTLFVGKIVEAEIIKEAEPMTYEYYHLIKGGKTPKTAPAYIKEERIASEPTKYVCSVCGYLYDPALGDPKSGIKPGTPFEELPENWTCPVCGAGKDAFQKVP